MLNPSFFVGWVGRGVNKGAQTSHPGKEIRGPIFNRSSPLSCPLLLLWAVWLQSVMQCGVFFSSLQFPATLGNDTCFLSPPFLSPVHSPPPNFFGIKQRGVFYSHLDEMLVHHKIPSIKQLGVLLLLPGWDVSPSQDTQYKVTRSITTPWLLDGTLVHHRIPSIKQLGVLLLLPGWDVSPSQYAQHKVTTSISTPP